MVEAVTPRGWGEVRRRVTIIKSTSFELVVISDVGVSLRSAVSSRGAVTVI